MTDPVGEQWHVPLGPGAEFDIVRAMLKRWPAASRGTGDDAATLDVPAGERLLVSTDTAVENVHFRRAWLSPREIGYRAGAAAISDLAAMAATPLGMTVALTLPESWRADAESLADGLGDAARDTATPIIGGDLTRGTELSLTITVVGTSARPLGRDGARPGDSVWVTGRLGGPLLAQRAFESGVQPRADQRARFAHPVPRLREARWLQARGATAAIDCSDGVAADLTHVAAASHARIALHLDRLPRVPGAGVDDAARSGEEYELIVTGPATLDAAAFSREFGIPLTAIGAVEAPSADGPGVYAYLGGAMVSRPSGHDHFAR